MSHEAAGENAPFEEIKDPAREKHHEEALKWLEYAEGDSAVVHHLQDGFFHPRCSEIICYHCSQAAEKAVKAVLVDLGCPGGMPQKHDIAFILNQMKNIIKKEKGMIITEEMLDMADELSDYSDDAGSVTTVHRKRGLS